MRPNEALKLPAHVSEAAGSLRSPAALFVEPQLNAGVRQRRLHR